MRKQFLLSIIFAVTQSFIAQHKYDIGLSFSDQTIGYGTNSGNLNLEFRNKINDKWRLSSGLNYGGAAFNNSNQTFFDFSDSSITYRYSNLNYGNEFNVQLGLERSINSILGRPLKQKIISYSFDLLFGTKSFAINKFNETTFFDSIYVHVSSGLMGDTTHINFHTERSNRDYYSVDYINVGFQFQIKANIPLNSKLTLFVSQRHFFALFFDINESTEHPTPNLVGATQLSSSSNVPLNDINHRFYNSLGKFGLNHVIGVRYNFNKKSKKETMPIEK